MLFTYFYERKKPSIALAIIFLNPVINAVPSTVSDHEQTPTRNNDPRVLNCHVPTSLPGAVVTWFRRGNALGESDLADRLGITRDGRLVFSAFTSSDTGVYSCQVGNDVVGSTQPSSSYILTLGMSQQVQDIVLASLYI